MMDSHTDTVGVGDPKEWAWDPYQGKVEDGYIYGRGACDQRAGMASMVYAGKLIKELGSGAITRCTWSARCRKRIATAFAGSTS
jgi:acetylornithine deacetylase/succinyl-diaminopimelate desuccinylase-like protein